MLYKRFFISILVFIIVFTFFVFSVQASGRILYFGMRGQDVVELQSGLKKIGFFPQNVRTTGYYGNITRRSVKKFQQYYGLSVDGIAGPETFRVFKALNKKTFSSNRGENENREYLLPWFGGVENIFKIGDIAKVLDVETGLTYKLKRTFGYNHADCETLTAKDTEILLKTYGGKFSWKRRAIIVEVHSIKMAASIAAMPHAGREDLPSCAYVSWRSGGYGSGANLDEVKGNNMSGVVDVHFLGSKTHATNRVSRTHQEKVVKAAKWAKLNRY